MTTIHEIAYEEIKSHGGLMPLKKIYQAVLNKFEQLGLKKPKVDSIRGALIDRTAVDPDGRTGRKADNSEILFERISNGIYKIVEKEFATCVLHGNGREDTKTLIEDESLDLLLLDHAWSEGHNHKAGNQKNFAGEYEDVTFRYTLEDFKEKARMLKPGRFLVENVPAENGVNSDYLMDIRKYAKQAGFTLYCVVPWRKYEVPKNTGRTQKDREYLLFFTKGKPRRLAPKGKPYYTTQMIPAEFFYPAPNPNEKIHQAEKPLELYKHIMELLTLPNELVCDLYAGSGNVGKAALSCNRNSLLFEILPENIRKIRQNLGLKREVILEKVKQMIEQKPSVKIGELVPLF